MRSLNKEEISSVNGGCFLLNCLAALFVQPKCDPKPHCEEKPKCGETTTTAPA